MKDHCRRTIDYIRISVTDRCNLRCVYCMPKDGIVPLPHSEILSYDEIVRLCRCFSKLGIEKIKITGGEPLVRKNISELIKQMKQIEGIKNVTITTNGLQLKKQLPDLMRAGMDGVNISLDTLNPTVYKEITGANGLQIVLDGIEAALKYETLKVKINCVPIQGMNLEELEKIACLAKNSNISVRFIEIMPIGLGKNYIPYGENEIIKELEQVYGSFEPCKEKLGNGPAHYFSIPGFKGKIGFISALSHQFCEECNRVRLTSEGFLKTCLQYSEGADLKILLRGNADDAYITKVICETIYSKPIHHNFNEQKEQLLYEQKQMHKIGG